MTYYDARAAGKPYLRSTVRDAQGTIIPFVIWCNTATGEAESYEVDPANPGQIFKPPKGQDIPRHRAFYPKPLTVREE
jgi:hypothetical protein